jgi:hypothetical protein
MELQTKQTKAALLFVCFLLVSFWVAFDHEDRGSTFFRNIDELLSDKRPTNHEVTTV